MLGLTETTPFSAEEVAITGESQLSGRLQDFIGPSVQGFLFQLKGADVLAARLVDGHADVVDVVDVIEQLQRTEGVALHLGIVLRRDQNTKAVLVIDDAECTVSDDDAVGGSEALFYPVGEVHTLFDKDDRVGAGLLGGFHLFHDEGCIAVGAVLHLGVVPSEVFGRVFDCHAQRLAELVLAKAVRVGSFGSVVATFILIGLTQSCGRRAMEPTFRRRCGEDCMSFRRHHSTSTS